MAFSAADSAFEGFRIAREKPLAVVAWAVLLFLNGVVSWYVMVTQAGPELQTYSALSPGDVASMTRTVSAFVRAFAILLPLWLVVHSVLAASVNRVVLRPDDRGFLWMKVGADEARQAVVLIVLGLMSFAAYMAAAMLTSVVMGLVLGSAGGMGVGSSAVILATGVAFIAAACAFLVILARLAVASPMTFDLKRIEIFAASQITQGRFGQMLGAYLLALAMVALVDLLIFVIFLSIAAVIAGGVNVAMETLQPKFATLSYYFSPLRILYLAFTSVMSALGYAIWFGVAPRAYQQLRGQAAPSVFS